MKYKVGDRVKIKSLDWYYANKAKNGYVNLLGYSFAPGMTQFCGKVVTIENISEHIEGPIVYHIEGTSYVFTNEMIEGLAEENVITNKDFCLTKQEFDAICDELGLKYTWIPFINCKTIGSVHFTINDNLHFHFRIDWKNKNIQISRGLCEDLHIGSDKEGVYELSIANVEELLNSIASYREIYKPVLTNKL